MKSLVNKTFASIMLASMYGVFAPAQTIVLHGDVNGDDKVNVADISSLITSISNGDTVITDKTPEEVNFIDLGLPSGTKWANMNLGALSQEDNGFYFAWGDTCTIKDNYYEFNWEHYTWLSEEGEAKEDIQKYQVYDGLTSGDWFIEGEFCGDNRAVLLLEDDAANNMWGGYWRMPTYEDFVELITYCTSSWEEVSGKKGRKFTSKINGECVFFPAAGWKTNAIHERDNEYGYYWSATVYPTYTPNAYYLYINFGNVRTNDTPRCYGLSIRPVYKK